MTTVKRKENTKFLTGNYAKQERATMLADLCKITNNDDLEGLLVEKEVNGLMHIFSGPRKPTFKQMLYFQAIISIAGNRLAELGDEVRAENFNDDDIVKHLLENMTDKSIEIKEAFGFGSQVVIYTSYHEILKKAGLNDGGNSRKALLDALMGLGRITHEVHQLDDYNKGKTDRGYNELFLQYKYDNSLGKVKIVLNSISSQALTSQFTLIDLTIKKLFLKNERALALYDFIVARVNHKEQQHFNMDRVIKILEHKNEEVDKKTRNKYKETLKKMSEVIPDWNIGTYGIGNKLVFNIDRQ
jgi:hypothetical protein